ncbi:MAG: HEPN domain-containing protein [Candidatus Njordarchaeum guaymaensis]
MRYADYLRKSKVLLKEAEIDMLNACYNKAVTGYWSSIEALLRAFLLLMKKALPERPGKLISLANRELRKIYPKYGLLVGDINLIYVHRRNVEHRPIIADKTLAKDIANRSRKVITKLNEIIEKLINEK